MSKDWIAERMKLIDASGIRKVFDLAAGMEDPVNLSIGQPHFDTPQEIKDAICSAIQEGKNAYSVTQGIAPLRELISQDIQNRYGHRDRSLLITSGTSGALMLVLSCLVNPGDEVMIFDPYFVMYKHLTSLAGGIPILIDTYPDFRIDLQKVEDRISERTKLILFNSPANPTGVIPAPEEVEGLALLAKKHHIPLLSDEIYRSFSYGTEFHSPAEFHDETIVIDGFSKSHSMTGHRIGYVHGPSEIIREMTKLQQFTFVCAPHPVQWGGIVAFETDISPYVEAYHQKRDFLRDGLREKYEVHGGDGAFYLFVKSPSGTGTEFVKRAIEHNLLIIPGNVFSEQDTHFRISYAAEDSTLKRGLEILLQLAETA